jgi:hypothetical protein
VTGAAAHPASLDRAATFVWGHARLLERALFARRFLGAPAEPVVAALLGYRNPDGGFGHALEPDVRSPHSMPLHCEIALRALQDAGIRHAEIAEGICRFLASVAEASGRVPIVLPGVLDYPHAAHWNVPSAADSPNPTAALVGLLRAQGAKHPWLERAESWCFGRLAEPIAEAHQIAACLAFLEHAWEPSRADALALSVAAQAAKASFYRADPASEAYGVSPLQLCPTPASLGRRAFDDALLGAHLDALAAAQQEDGGWPISFLPPSPAAVHEWRGRWTLEALGTLRAYGRL